MKLTFTNRYVLRETFRSSERVSNRLPASNYSHLQRCLKLGLISVEGNELVLTDAGREALGLDYCR